MELRHRAARRLPAGGFQRLSGSLTPERAVERGEGAGLALSRRARASRGVWSRATGAPREQGWGVMVPDVGNPQPKPRSTGGMSQVPVRTSQPPPSVCSPNQPCPRVTGSRHQNNNSLESVRFKRNWRCFSNTSHPRVWDSWDGLSEVPLGEAGANRMLNQKRRAKVTLSCRLAVAFSPDVHGGICERG